MALSVQGSVRLVSPHRSCLHLIFSPFCEGHFGHLRTPNLVTPMLLVSLRRLQAVCEVKWEPFFLTFKDYFF